MARGRAASRHLEDMSVRFKRGGAPCFLGSSPIARVGEGAPSLGDLIFGPSVRRNVISAQAYRFEGACNEVAHNPGPASPIFAFYSLM